MKKTALNNWFHFSAIRNFKPFELADQSFNNITVKNLVLQTYLAQCPLALLLGIYCNFTLSHFQSVTKTQLEVCLKDIQRYDASHDPITVNYMAIGCK